MLRVPLDLRFAARSLLKRPGPTAAALIALALGIGANSALFTAADAVLWRPLPFGDADRVAFVGGRDLASGRALAVSYADFLDWRARTHAFEELAAVGDGALTLSGDQTADLAAERVSIEWISDGYFRAVGAEPVLGRGLRREENATPGTRPVAILGDDLWRRRFGADPQILNREVRLNGQPITVIGVAPPGFHGVGGEAEAWVPMMMFDATQPDLRSYDILGDRAIRWHAVVGRLAAATDLDRAGREMDAIAAELRREHPDKNADKGARVVGAREELTGDLRRPLLLLLGATVLVLAIACANLAHLLLARAAVRRHELELRVVLGAGRGRMVRLLLGESLLLAGAGAVAGLLLAQWAIEAVGALAPAELPRFVTLRLDGRGLAVAVGAALVVGLLAGLLPALSAAAGAARGGLSGWGPRAGGGRAVRRSLGTLVVAEIGLAVVLLVGAGLMVKSLQRTRAFDPGFRSDGLLTARFDLPAGRYDGPAQTALRDRLAERIAAIPGVTAAAFTSHVYFGGGYLTRDATPEGAASEQIGYFQWVGPGSFKTLGLPLQAGRDFTAGDDGDAPGVAVVSSEFARRAWPGENAVGKRLKLGKPDKDRPWLEVVGVAAEVLPRLRPTAAGRLPQVYLPLAQGGEWGRGLLVRTRTDPAALVAPLRAAVAEVDPEIPLFDVAPMADLLRGASARTRLLTALLVAFAVVAAALAATGIYGVTAFAAGRRRHEIGVRMACGARRRDVGSLLFRRAAAEAAAGVALGLAGAWLLSRTLASLVYEVDPRDPAVFAATAAVAAGAALLGGFLPARRASRLDPREVLEGE